MTLWGGIEAGGTKVVCAVGTGPGNIVAEETYGTRTPKLTIAQVTDFFIQTRQIFGDLKSVGVGSFGPLDLNKDSSTFGYITTTPKSDWAQTDFRGIIEKNLNLEVRIDTDVNVAALAENRWGAAKGIDTFIYLTVGTGIGGGGMIEGRLMHGLLHPEMGHMLVPRDKDDDHFPGTCPFHGYCLEGLAAGPSIKMRWGQKADELSENHPAWDLEAKYLAYALVNLILTISPKRIIMGGGVMQREQLFPLIRRKVLNRLKDYIKVPEISEHIDDYIIPPALGNKAGVLGAIALAKYKKI